MQWQHLADLILSNDWQLSPPTTAITFRFTHRFVNFYKYQTVAQVALARRASAGVEIFASQKINPKAELDIIQFPIPPSGWSYSLAVKQLVLPNQSLVSWNIKVDMPLIPVNPPDPTVGVRATTSFTPSSATVTNTATKILSASTTRQKFSIYNPSNKDSLYLDFNSTLTVASAALTIPPGNTYVDDINWAGEVYGVVKSGTVSVSVREFT